MSFFCTDGKWFPNGLNVEVLFTEEVKGQLTEHWTTLTVIWRPHIGTISEMKIEIKKRINIFYAQD